MFCDNYLDGGYHVPIAHPGLAAQLDLGGYRSELHPRLSLQVGCWGVGWADAAQAALVMATGRAVGCCAKQNCLPVRAGWQLVDGP